MQKAEETHLQSAHALYAHFYDASLEDWPGEINFYRRLAAEHVPTAGSLLEVGCGTGRISLRLAQDGLYVTGMDLSESMLAIAQARIGDCPNVRFFQGDMRHFDPGQNFELAIIPGHSFQFMLTPEDQTACLGAIRRCLKPGGWLCIHTNHDSVAWLAGLSSGNGGIMGKPYELVHPNDGRRVRIRRAWSYAPATQTATAVSEWEEIDAAGRAIAHWQYGPTQLHVVSRFEMVHLFQRAGFRVDAFYGDFFGNEFQDDSESMVWVLQRD